MLLKMHLVKVHIAVFWGFFPQQSHIVTFGGQKMKACFLDVLPSSASCFCIPFPMYINMCFIKLFMVQWYYEWITHVSNVQQCVADPPCAGRGTSLWHLVHSPRAPRDARVSLERERETQRKQRVGSNVINKMSCFPIILKHYFTGWSFFLWWRNASIPVHILPKHKVQQDI